MVAAHIEQLTQIEDDLYRGLKEEGVSLFRKQIRSLRELVEQHDLASNWQYRTLLKIITSKSLMANEQARGAFFEILIRESGRIQDPEGMMNELISSCEYEAISCLAKQCALPSLTSNKLHEVARHFGDGFLIPLEALGCEDIFENPGNWDYFNAQFQIALWNTLSWPGNTMKLTPQWVGRVCQLKRLPEGMGEIIGRLNKEAAFNCPVTLDDPRLGLIRKMEAVGWFDLDTLVPDFRGNGTNPFEALHAERNMARLLANTPQALASSRAAERL